MGEKTKKVPDELYPIVNEELIDKLIKLTPKQVEGISRIIAAGYVTEKPLCPTYLLRGEDAICSVETFYAPGIWDVDKQKWSKLPGWSKQPEFMDALMLAKRLAIRHNTEEEYTIVREAIRRAKVNSTDIVSTLLKVAVPDEEYQKVGDKRSQIAAATLILKYAGLDNSTSTEVPDSAENDWWEASDE